MISEVVTVPNWSKGKDRRVLGNTESTKNLREYFIGPENAALLKTFEFQDSTRGLLTNLEFNPVVVHGRIGVGKTHLLEYLSEIAKSKSKSIISTDSNLFSAECTKASKLGNIDSLKKRFKSASYVFFDDVHLLKTKPYAQQQLGLIVEDRANNRLTTVFAAKQNPQRLDLSSFLTSRISSGIVLRLKAPSQQTRIRLIQDLSNQLKLEISPDAINLIAETMDGTAYQLKNVLVEMAADKDAAEEISVEQVFVYFRKPSLPKIAPKKIIRETAKHYGLKVSDVVGTSRRKQNVTARSVAMYLIRRLTKQSFQKIGQLFGNRDHTTVLHAFKKVNSLKKSEAHTRDVIIQLAEKLVS